MTGLRDQLSEVPLVAILRAATGERLVEVSRVLAAEGIPAVELTMTTPGHLRALETLRGDGDDALWVGAGTVRTAADAAAAVDAGAQFLVNMAFEPGVREVAESSAVPYIPGALTPTEISRAWSAGASEAVPAVKVSPVGCLGGPAYIRELVGPWPDIPLFPTGGVRLDDVPDYLAAGAAVVGVSGHLVGDALTPSGDLEALRGRARELVAAARR